MASLGGVFPHLLFRLCISTAELLLEQSNNAYDHPTLLSPDKYPPLTLSLCTLAAVGFLFCLASERIVLSRKEQSNLTYVLPLRRCHHNETQETGYS